MKKKLIKIILLILIIVSVFNYYTVYATDYDQFKPVLTEESNVITKASVILGYINIIGIVVSVITVIAIGIRYLSGTIEEKAEYKKTMGMYLLGAFLIFSVTTIPNFAFIIGDNLLTQSGDNSEQDGMMTIYCTHCGSGQQIRETVLINLMNRNMTLRCNTCNDVYPISEWNTSGLH